MYEYIIQGSQGHYGEPYYCDLETARADREYARLVFPRENFIILRRTVSKWEATDE